MIDANVPWKEWALATEPIISPPGSIHMLTRRVLLRLLLLLPTKELVQLFLYILGYLQAKFDLEYHFKHVDTIFERVFGE